MPPSPFDPERLWAEILSGDAGRIRRAFAQLSPDETAPVVAHLQRMAMDEGWQPGQRLRARAALEVVDSPRPSAGKESP